MTLQKAASFFYKQSLKINKHIKCDNENFINLQIGVFMDEYFCK